MKYCVDFDIRKNKVKNPNKKWGQFWKDDYIYEYTPEVSIQRLSNVLASWLIYVENGDLKVMGPSNLEPEIISLKELNDNLLRKYSADYSGNIFYKKAIATDYKGYPIYSLDEYDFSSIKYLFTEDFIDWDKIKRYLDNNYEENN